MKKFLTVRVCAADEHLSIQVTEPPEVAALLEEGWRIQSVHTAAAGAAEIGITCVAFLVLEK